MRHPNNKTGGGSHGNGGVALPGNLSDPAPHTYNCGGSGDACDVGEASTKGITGAAASLSARRRPELGIFVHDPGLGAPLTYIVMVAGVAYVEHFPTLAQAEAFISPERLARLDDHPGCATCAEVKVFIPHHDASPWCKSGKRAHCSCEVCW